MEAIRIIKEMREATNGVYPRIAVWENVPGAFSSNKGEDFRIVLEEFIKVVEPTAVMPEVPKNGWPYADSYCGDGWSLSYRVFDAQFWGVPQRRRRIYLVADFGGQCAGKISFESEGLRGHLAQSGAQRKAVAGDAEGGSGATDCTGSGVTAFSFDSLASNSMKSANPHSGCRQVEVSKCLDTTNPDPSKNQGGVAVVEAVPYTLKIRGGVEIDSAGKAAGKGALIQTDLSATLGVSQDQYLFQPVAFDGANITSPLNKTNPQPGDPCHTLSTDSRNYVVQLASGNDVTGCLMASGYEKLGAQEMFSGDYTVIEGQPVYCLQGNGIDRADTAGCNGKGVREDVCYTLNTIDRPAVAYLASGKKTVGTLMANAGTKLWLGNQEAFSGDYHIIEDAAVRYIVRRLTPTECARLQGFPDDWGHPDVKDSLTDEEYTFWLNVRNTHAAINDKAVKDYTKEQMLTWYNKLHTDSAEYKLWGNGIALPCALYVMQGIAEGLHEN
jgi:DNA (cytosine-5)-methyltransferase 1